MIEVTFTTTAEDYVNYALRAASRSPMMRARFLAGWLLFPAFFLARAATFLFSTDSWKAALVSATGAGLWLAIFPFAYRFACARSLRRHINELDLRGEVGSIRLQLTEESLVEITSSVRTEACWRNMVGMEVVGDCTYIHLTPLSATLIPRHGFEREEDYVTVRDFATARLKDASRTSVTA